MNWRNMKFPRRIAAECFDQHDGDRVDEPVSLAGNMTEVGLEEQTQNRPHVSVPAFTMPNALPSANSKTTSYANIASNAPYPILALIRRSG